MRFVTRRVTEPDLAEDIVHDVLVRALARQDALRDLEKLRPWLFQITRNAVADHFRARRPNVPLPDDLPAADDGLAPDYGLAPSGDDTDSAERRLAECCVGEFVNRLPDAYRQAITLAELDGLRQREVAERLDLTLSGAKSRVQRARRMLLQAFHDCCRIQLDRRGRVMDYACRESCEPVATRPPNRRIGAKRRASYSSEP